MNRFSNTFQYEQYQSQQYQPQYQYEQYQPQTQYQYEHYQSQSQSQSQPQSHKLQPKLRIAVSETAKRKKRNSKTTTKKRKKTATQEEKATAHIAMEDAEDDQVIMADDVDNDEINDIEFFSKLISLDKLNALVSDAATEITQLYDDFTFMKSNPFALHLYYSSKNYE